MPLYDYECLSCGHIFELRQSFDALPEGTCPECEGSSRRRFNAVPIIYKGSGFYTTDYKRAGAASTGTGAKSTVSSDDKDDKKEEPKKTDTSSKASKEKPED